MVNNQYTSNESNESVSYEIGLKIRDLEDSSKLTKERMLLIGKNLIEFQDKSSKEIVELKKEVYEIKTDLKRIKEIIESISEEVSKSARKDELMILLRQFKMFQPLEFARVKDVNDMIEEKIHHHKKNDHKENSQNDSHLTSSLLNNSNNINERENLWRNKL